MGCSPGVLQPRTEPTACNPGTCLLDSTCVSQNVCDYVGCVRAQGAKLTKDKGDKLSADVGYAAVRVGGSLEVRDQLWQTYQVSDANVLAVIQGCNSFLPHTDVPDVSGTWTMSFEHGGEKPFQVHLQQSGDKVTMPMGSFGQGAGQLDAKTYILIGHWNETTRGGPFSLQFSKDLQSFSGDWSFEGESVKYTWKGTRTPG